MATRRIVGFWRTEQRKDRRREALAHGVINGVGVRIRNVSHSGLDIEIEDSDPDLGAWAVGQVCALHLSQPKRPAAPLDVRITRIDEDSGNIAGAFDRVSEEQYKVIERLVLRGRV